MWGYGIVILAIGFLIYASFYGLGGDGDYHDPDDWGD